MYFGYTTDLMKKAEKAGINNVISISNMILNLSGGAGGQPVFTEKAG